MSAEPIVALVGRRDEPTDGVADYCSWLGGAVGEFGYWVLKNQNRLAGARLAIRACGFGGQSRGVARPLGPAAIHDTSVVAARFSMAYATRSRRFAENRRALRRRFSRFCAARRQGNNRPYSRVLPAPRSRAPIRTGRPRDFHRAYRKNVVG